MNIPALRKSFVWAAKVVVCSAVAIAGIVLFVWTLFGLLDAHHPWFAVLFILALVTMVLTAAAYADESRG